MKAHMTYMSMAAKAAKKTTSLIQEVAHDETLEPEKKLQALDYLSSHLKKIQSDVENQQDKVASLAEVAGAHGDEDEDEEAEATEAPAESLAQTGAAEGNLRHGEVA